MKAKDEHRNVDANRPSQARLPRFIARVITLLAGLGAFGLLTTKTGTAFGQPSSNASARPPSDEADAGGTPDGGESADAQARTQDVEAGADAASDPDDAGDKEAGAKTAAAAASSPKKKVDIERLPIVDADPPSSTLPAKRAVPDYDGRGEEPTTAGDVLLWIPRVLLAPLYFVSEYLIRRPIGAAVIAIERDKLAQRAVYIFTVGGSKNFGWLPTFFYDFNLLPSVGVYVWWDDALASKNHMRFHVGTWGPNWLNANVRDRYDLGEHSTVSLRAAFSRRRDNLFFGLGPDSKTQNESRYEATNIDVNTVYDLEAFSGARFTATTGVRDVSFGEGTCCQSATLHERIRAGQLQAPPRLDDGYTIVYQNALAAFDTRTRKRPANQSGVRVALSGEPAFDVSHRPGNSWLSYEATLGGFLDITGTARVLSLTASTLFVDPLQGGAGGNAIPFTEQVGLGGVNLMRGFLPGRLIDRSAAVATLGYQYPIWAFLDGTMQASVGNVFGAGLRGFEPGKLRLSAGTGIRSNSSPDQQLELLVGFGTTPFDEGASPTSFRLAFGATRGF